MAKENIIPGYRHKPGFHCASSAICNLLAFWGIGISEPAVIGLGRAPGFIYNIIDGTPSRFIIMRHLELEQNFFSTVGIKFDWQQTESAPEATRLAKEFIDRGLPLLVQTDIAYLPYFNTDQHFIGHAVVICGYNDSRGEFYVSDTLHPETLSVAYADMEKARSACFPPFDLRNRFFALESISDFHMDEAVVRRAVRRWADENLNGISECPYTYGIRSLEKVIYDLPQWKHSSDWQWSARFTYQVIERRGTGGAGFRTLYRQFLEEQEIRYQSLEKFALSSDLAIIEDLYHELAATFRQISEKDSPDFTTAASVLEKILEREKTFYCRILAEF